MNIRDTEIPDLKIMTPTRFTDQRGYFFEAYNKRDLATAGIAIDFVQDNQAYAATPGTMRGLHFQKPPATQTKLLRVLRGRILDVVVDLRVGSPTYCRHALIELSAQTGEQVLCPQGFAHGFVTLEPDVEVTYKVDAHFAPALESGIRFDDPDLNIPWPMGKESLLVSEKDQNLPRMRDLGEIFWYDGSGRKDH